MANSALIRSEAFALLLVPSCVACRAYPVRDMHPSAVYVFLQSHAARARM